MKTRIEWRRNGWACRTAAGWQLFNAQGTHLGTVFLDGAWYCNRPDTGDHAAGSQPLAAQALLRAAGVEP